jgi:regulator of RNase E activity RraA
MITPEILTELGKYDTPTVCNVIELFRIRPDTVGYMNNRVQAVFQDLPPIVGFASTATCRTAVSPAGGGTYTKLSAHIERFEELSGPPIVVFQDLDQPSAAATFGEIMCTTYQAFGALGLITNGPGRDIEQVHALRFPIFTDGTCCSHGYFHGIDAHVPIHMGGIPVLPDDLLHADVNGITTIPKEIAADVAWACAEFVAAEKGMLEAMHAEQPTMARLREVMAEKDRLTGEIERQLAARRVL